MSCFALRDMSEECFLDFIVEAFDFFRYRSSYIKDPNLRIVSSIFIAQKQPLAVSAPKMPSRFALSIRQAIS